MGYCFIPADLRMQISKILIIKTNYSFSFHNHTFCFLQRSGILHMNNIYRVVMMSALSVSLTHILRLA
jgi:hypothetical protein